MGVPLGGIYEDKRDFLGIKKIKKQMKKNLLIIILCFITACNVSTTGGYDGATIEIIK